ncbi:BolA family transcriptional regulator [Candidatus Marinamargulisbacteria bacterium SCGC AG-410-N11]|nr:BolA family transcriptional regulator [Candidatus Marinamargulisbacteria bacterium SCGC AG-410-N11]
MVTTIKSIILNAIPDATVFVLDPQNDGVHFEALVISDSFTGLSLVKQHQLVMNSLKEEFKERVHALALKTFTPAKWETAKSNYPLAH